LISNTLHGVSSTYACYNCCPDSIYSDGNPTPYFVGIDVGAQQSYGFEASTNSCYGYQSPQFLASGYNWTSSDALTAEIDYNSGLATAMDGGTAYLTGYFDNVTWTGGTLACNSQTNTVYGSSEMEVRPRVLDVIANGATRVTQVVGNTNIIHFVTPKDGANSQVTLTATISPNTQQILDKIS
jgi:hypothetical protein